MNILNIFKKNIKIFQILPQNLTIEFNGFFNSNWGKL